MCIKNYFELVNKEYLNNNFKLESRIDPDSKCYSLYEDLTKKLFYKSFPNGYVIKKTEFKERMGKNENKYWELVMTVESIQGEKKIFGLGADYIGASVNWALQSNIPQIDIKEFLKISRILGGHIFFPRWQISNNKKQILSLNVARGAEFIRKNKRRPGFYDRFDMFLFDLKNWYDGNLSQLQEEFDSNEVWLKLFIDFRGFINYFLLNDFVNNDFEVIDLTNNGNFIEQFESYIPKNSENYSLYFENSNNIIINRFKDSRN